MALLSLFTQTRAKIGAIEIDCSVEETHERSADLTRYPVEAGSTISDNVVLHPKKLTLEGVISKTPLGVAGLVGSAVSAAAGAVGKLASAKAANNKALANAAATTGVASIGGLATNKIFGSTGTDAEGNQVTRDPADVFKALEELWRNRIPLTVVTALTGATSATDQLGLTDSNSAVYTNMIMTALSVPRSKDTVNALRFTATLEQVTVVTTQFGSLSDVPGASAAQNLGKQATGSPSAGVSASADAWSVQYLGLPGA